MTYYFLTEELGKKLRAGIDKNEDLSSIFNSQKYKDERASWWLFQYDLGDMVFYAITQDKTESATQDKTESATQDKTESATQDKTESATQDKTESATQDKTESATQDKTESATQDKTESATQDKTESATQGKTESAKSILEHIQSQESQKFFYSKLAKELVQACNEDKQIAIRVIDFAKKHDILQYLFDDLYDDIRAELLKKHHGEYVHSSGKMVDDLKKKCSYKGKSNGELDTGTIMVFYSPAIFCVGLAILCVATTSGEPNPGQKAMLTGLVAFTAFSFVLISTILLCCYAASSIANYFSNRERNNIVKKLQTQSENQQNLQLKDAAPTTDKQEVGEKDTPSSDSSVSGIVGNKEVRGDKSKRRS